MIPGFECSITFERKYFWAEYKRLQKKLGADKPKETELQIGPDSIVLKLTY